MDKAVTIAMADDHPLMLKGMSAFFAEMPRYEMVGQAENAGAALELVEQTRPEILLMDFSMPGNVVGAIGQIATDFPQTRVIILTAFSSVESAVKALDAGAMGFALKGSPVAEIIEAIEAVLTGQIYVARQYATQVLMGLRSNKDNREVRQSVRLNIRERQIVGQLLHARTNREIAENLHLSEKTVKHYMTGLMSKLNARNRVEVVLAAQQNMDS